MRRREFAGYNDVRPIRGARFTFRTFHADGHRTKGERQFSLDRYMTVTLPAIEGEKHKTKAHMEVAL